MTDETESAASEEVEEWDEENDDPHPVFEVDHRPERQPLKTESDGCEWIRNSERCGNTVAYVVEIDDDEDDLHVCERHREAVDDDRDDVTVRRLDSNVEQEQA